MHLLLQSACKFLTGRFVCHHTDNQNVEQILAHGSRVEKLQTEAIGIYELCMRHFIRIDVRWIPRELNEKAGYLSKFVCKDDYKLDEGVFNALDSLWGRH